MIPTQRVTGGRLRQPEEEQFDPGSRPWREPTAESRRCRHAYMWGLKHRYKRPYYALDKLHIYRNSAEVWGLRDGFDSRRTIIALPRCISIFASPARAFAPVKLRIWSYSGKPLGPLPSTRSRLGTQMRGSLTTFGDLQAGRRR